MRSRRKRVAITIGMSVVFGLIVGCLFLHENYVNQAEDQADVCLQMTESVAEKKKIALTFDDGPHPVYTPMLLEGLEKRDVKVTFFVMGTAVETYPEIAKQMSEQGHLIGNHTYHHVSLEDADDELIQKEVASANELIERITGQCPQFLRPPFGDSGGEIEKQAEMICVMWDVDPLDWCTEDASLVVERVMSHAEDNSIILLHDQYKSSVQAAFTIIDELQKQGYEFVTVDELIYE